MMPAQRLFFSRFGRTKPARAFLPQTAKYDETAPVSLSPPHTQVLSEHFPGVELAHDIRSLQSLPEVEKKERKRERRREEKGPAAAGCGGGGEKLTPSEKKKSPPNSSTQGNRPRRRRLPLRGRLPGRAQGRARRQGVGAGARCFRDSLFFSLFFLASRRWMKEKGKLSPLSSLSRLLVQNEILQKCRETPDRSSTSSAS